jgi:Myb-like DNA-binding domain
MDSTEFKSRVFLQGREVDKESLKFAIDFYTKKEWHDREDVADCIELAANHAEKKPRTHGRSSAQEPALFADSLNSLELVKAILPWVENVRKKLFGSRSAPFESYRDVIKWLESEERKVSTPPLSELQRVMAEIAEKVAQLPHSFSREFHLNMQAFYVPYIKAGNEESILASTEKLRRLHDETKEMEKATGFDQRQLVAFILANIQPRLPVVRVTMPFMGAPTQAYNLPTDDGSILRFVARLECLSPRELKLAHLKRFYSQLRQNLKIVKKKTLTNEDRLLLSLIEQYGRAPKRGRLDYWQKIAKDYNRKAKKRVSGNALRMRWRRLDDKKGTLELFKKQTTTGKPLGTSREQFSRAS